MLNIINLEKQTKPLSSGEIMQYIPVPEKSYSLLKKDFKYAAHFASVEELELTGAKGVIIKCEYEQDGLLAAAYLYKKYLENEKVIDNESDDEDEDFDDEIVVEDYEEDGDLEDEIEKILYEGYHLKNLPVVSSEDFAWAYAKNSHPFSWNNGPYSLQVQQEKQNRKPYWYFGEYPLIVLESGGMKPMEALKQIRRFIIYISPKIKHSPFIDTSSLDAMDRTIIFEQDFEICHIAVPENTYYEMVLKECVKLRGFKLSRSIDKSKLIDKLKVYRRKDFDSNRDISLLINKAIRKKNDPTKILQKVDFEKVFLRHSNFLQQQKLQNSTAQKDLEKLIGHEPVKAQLTRIVKRMKFSKARKSQGFKTEAFHCSAVFMGNPGTAKTTIARIFGKMLCEEGVLENDGFFEVSRKDLIGQYVGHTAPIVAGIFEMAKGGTIFIDEAYSLMSEGPRDSFSDEALAEIIRQMENNPRTLVLFAGYTQEMKKFILNCNPGLRSRLTNVIEFPDYSVEELIDIFVYLIEREEYRFEDLNSARDIVHRFITELNAHGTKNTGNGRAMRKLYQSAVGFMAERIDGDLQTIEIVDLEKAAQEILQSERLLDNRENKAVGFLC